MATPELNHEVRKVKARTKVNPITNIILRLFFSTKLQLTTELLRAITIYHMQ